MRARRSSGLILAFVTLWLMGGTLVNAQPAPEPEGLLDMAVVDSAWTTVPEELRGAVGAMETGDYAGAAAELHDLVLRDSSNVQAMRLLASAFAHLEAYVQTIEICERIAALDTVDAGVMVALGFYNQKLGDFDSAEVYYRRALDREPRTVQGYQGLGWIHLQRRQLEQAHQMGTRSAELAPDYAPNYILMGRVLTAQGFYKSAADAYRKAFTLRPDLRDRYGILLQEISIRHKLTH